MPLAHARLKDGAAQSAGRGLAFQPPSRDRLPMSMLLQLQRLAGNRAVADLIGTPPRASVQRVTLGWQGADDDSWNKGAETITAEGKKGAPGDEGVVRIPVGGIAAGQAGSVKGEEGGDSDPNIHQPKDWKPSKPGEKYRVAVSSVTGESVGSKDGGQAIVIVPQGLARGPVDVLFHLHGHTIGYRQAKHGKGKPAPPRDILYDRIEQQLLAASKAGWPMIGILPQGAFFSQFGPGGQLGVNVDAYVNDVFGLGLKELGGTTPGRVSLSGWSGAGLGITQMVAGSKAKAAGEKIPGGATGSLLPTSDFEGLFLFDAIYGNYKKPPGPKNWLGPVWDLLQQRLEHDLSQLLADPSKQESYLSDKGFRFRGIYTERGGCKENYEHLRDPLLEGWFGTAAVKALPPTVQQSWRANYQVQPSGKGVVHNVMIGKQGGADQENLLKAIEMLPKPAAAHAAGAAHGRAAPAAASASTHRGSPDELLVASAAALGRAGKGSARPAGGTLLHQEDVRTALTNRSKNAALAEQFLKAQTMVAAVPEGAGRIAAAQQQAAGLVRLIELQFILDPSRSALDLLPPDRAKHWRDFAWEKGDYPGNEGPHQDEAGAMAREMTTVRAERRPNSEPTAVLLKKDATPERWQYIDEHAVAVPGEPGKRLYEEAGESFAKMREAAKADGVKIHIAESRYTDYRPHAIAEAMAKKRKQRIAQAAFSSHSLGLAADLQMSAGKQKFLETTTTPMQNVADMRSAPAHKWMMLRGEAYGWYPYGNEPWHWEYNPPGLPERFFNAAALVAPAKEAKPVPAAAPAKEVKPGAKAVPAGPTKAALPADDTRLSGPHWAGVKEYLGSKSMDTLVDPFKGNITSFIAMLRANHALVNINATYRPPERAWLMHWAWYIGKGWTKYSKIASIKNPYNIDIVWDHGDDKSTRKAALAMAAAFGMAHQAALKSRHTEGHAVDINITRLPEVLTIDKKEYPIGVAKAEHNEALWFVGEHLFSVVKHHTDRPHWSTDGF